jgi:hypothetical protein
MKTHGFWLLAVRLFTLLSTTPGSYADDLIEYTNDQGQTEFLGDYRKPALYTQTFGSCMSSNEAAITINRFDAALYMDNMTVVFTLLAARN